MHNTDNEFSLNLFTDYRTQEIKVRPIIEDSRGWTVNFNTKTVTITKPIKFIDLYRGLSNTMNNVGINAHETPILKRTNNLFELINDWKFSDDPSRKNIRDAGWTEGDEQWICIKPVGCNGDIDGLSYEWEYETGTRTRKFDNIATLTTDDSGQACEPIKVEGTPSQLSININGKYEYRDIKSSLGFINFNSAGVVVVPVCWYPSEPYSVSFNITGLNFI